jgi:hypothetical protein
MKTVHLVLASLVCLPLLGLAQAPVGPGSVKLDKVQPEVVKTPEFNITGGSNKRFKTMQWLEIEVGYETKAEEIDELTFSYTAQIEKQILTGEVTYVNIGKGRDHFAVMYLSPKGLDKLLNGKPLTPAAIENVWVEVNRQGQKLDMASYKPGAIPNAAKKAGFLLNKLQTPFSPLYWDRYEEIKPTK